MKKHVLLSSCLICFVLVSITVAADPQIDLRQAVPADAYLAIYGKRNSERDFQRKYLTDVCATVQETRLLERLTKIVTSRIPADDLDEAKSVFDELQSAAEPMDMNAILNCQEVVYAQTMRFPTSHHLVLLRLTEDAAAGCEKGMKNLFALAEEHSDGEVAVETATHGATELTTLNLPGEAPFRPAIARVEDVILFSSSEDLASESLSLIAGEGGDSKFDDPRLKQALSHLPAPEDSLVFYDGRQQFEQLRGMMGFVKQQAGENEDAERWIGLMDKIFDELSVLDYEVTVEYTDDNRNRKATLGRLLPGYEDKMLGKAFGTGQPFTQWHRWVPAEATSYSLSSGVNLHAIYDGVIGFIKQNIPEAEEGLERLDQMQQQIDLDIDRDILQAFSGEFVSVSFPAAVPAGLSGQNSVVAMRCQKPERIRELLHRGVEQLQKFPAVQAQQLEVSTCEELAEDGLEGFEEIHVALFNAFGARPVFGFHDGWMICGSNPDAVRTVVHAREGKADTIAASDAFRKFQLEVEGPVRSISYVDLAAGTRRAAMMIGQIGAFAPALIGMAGVEADPEDLKPVQELLGLLPDVAKIVSKFDYLEEKVSVTQESEQPGTYLRRSVVLVRPESTE